MIFSIKEFINKKKVEQMKVFYFTFGVGHANHPYYQPIQARNSMVARKMMMQMYGLEWDSQYDEETWKRDMVQYYPPSKALGLVTALD